MSVCVCAYLEIEMIGIEMLYRQILAKDNVKTQKSSDFGV